jgi:hypothetical protein
MKEDGMKVYRAVFLSAAFLTLIVQLLMPIKVIADETKQKADGDKKQPSTLTNPVQLPPPTTKPNKITQTAFAQGVMTCIPRINQVTGYVGYNDNLGAVLMVPPKQPDQTLVPIVMEIPLNTGNSAFVSSEFAPNQANGCGATFDAVVYWPEKCEVVVNKNFVTFKKTGFLTKDIQILSDGLYNKAFLMPAGEGCVSIKKELVM